MMTELEKPPAFQLSNGEAIPVAIISLKDQIDRRKALAELGIPRDWVDNYFPACDLRGLTAEEARKSVDTKTFFERYGFLEGPSQIGCAMSHRALTNHLAKSNSSMMLIFEDDIFPVDNSFLNKLDNICCQLIKFAKSGGSFILHLGIDGDTHLRIKRKVKSSSHPGAGRSSPIFEFTDLTSGQMFAHAYIVSRQAAAQTADKESQISSKIDWWFHRKQFGHFDFFLFTHPPIFMQNPAFESATASDRIKYEDTSKHTKKKKLISTRPHKTTIDRGYQSISFRSRRLVRRILSTFPRYIP